MIRTLAILSASILLAAAPSIARQPAPPGPPAEQPPVIVVSGTASLEVAPDQVEMNIAVISEGPQAQAAIGENNRKIARVIEAIHRKGIDPKDLTTGSFSVFPVYNQRAPRDTGEFNPKIVGYRVQNTLRLRTSKMDLAGDLIQLAVDSGANSVDSVRFTLRDPVEPRRRAIADAVRSAHADATAAAAAAGLTLSGVRRMDVGHSGGAPVPMMARMAMESHMADAVPMNPGDLTITASVTVEYLITEKK